MNVSVANNTDDGIKKKLFKLYPVKKDGLVIKIHHTKLQYSARDKCNVENRIRFVLSTFDESNKTLASSDLQGNIYLIDFESQKFWLLPTVESCSTLKFSPIVFRDLFIGLNDGMIIVIDIDTGCIKIQLHEHKSPIKSINFANDLCLTLSKQEAIIFNSVTYQKLHALSLKHTTLKYVNFVPTKNYIVACFEDFFINVWNSDNFESIKQILPTTWKRKPIKAITFSGNGRFMLLASHKDQFFKFSLETWEITETIPIPCIVKTIKLIEFLPLSNDDTNEILVILASNGILFFYDINTYTVFKQIQQDIEISSFTLAPDGSLLSLILHTGEVMVYNIYSLLFNDCEKMNKNTKDAVKKFVKMKIPLKRQLSIVVNTEKLKSILLEFGEYPSSYRSIIWAKILEVPGNVKSYESLNKEKTTFFSNIDKKYPLINQIALKNLKNLLKVLTNWCPFFGNVEFIPLFVFPFVRIFKNDPVMCFEAVCTILMNWCQHWFEYYPYPPVNLFAMIENLLTFHDPELLTHLKKHNITTHTYGWSLLEVAFSEVLTLDEWQILWDHVLSNEPSFILMAVVSYNIINRLKLLSFTKLEDFELFYHNQNILNMKKFINKTYSLNTNTMEKIHPRQYLNFFVPLSKNEYPMFLNYPKLSKTLVEVNENIGMEQDDLKKLVENTSMLQKLEKQKREESQKAEEESKRKKMVEEIYKTKLEKEIEKVQMNRKLVSKISQKIFHLETQPNNFPQNDSDSNDYCEHVQLDKKLSVRSSKLDKTKLIIIEEEQRRLQEEHENLKKEIDKIYKTLNLKPKLKRSKGGDDKITNLKLSTKVIEKEVEKLLTNRNDTKTNKKLNLRQKMTLKPKTIKTHINSLRMGEK